MMISEKKKHKRLKNKIRVRVGTFAHLSRPAKVTLQGAQGALVARGGRGRSRESGEKTPQSVLARRRFLPAVAPGPPRTLGDPGAIWKDLSTTTAKRGPTRPTFLRRPGRLLSSDPTSPEDSEQQRRADGRIQTRL